MNTREIDRLVAEKVMGWEYDHLYKEYFLKEYVGNNWHKKYVCKNHEFNPSTNIQDAWKVIEKLCVIDRLNKDGYDFQMWSENGKFNANFWKGDFYVLGFAESESAPLAICLAALETVGVEVEDDD